MKKFLKAIRTAACILLAVFAVLFAIVGISALFTGGLIGIIFGFAPCAFLAWVCWSVKGDVL